ncbi:pyridoxamine 5'-phosphate oxidase family protein [Micromonospora sp. MA102]|uniref:pyridoxamine 5'-phosphate oxidase family protein n=1 Tax=Micromonospora sp. MA102 TaxID=2952755 RepID=UPI0021C92500|nr:pyridoxamine 5'-phosphate oxidase family protein [Micromonospora sp. MA102]
MTGPSAVPPTDVEIRLPRESNAWLCTLRPDGSPHLTPVWFVYAGGLVDRLRQPQCQG